MSLLGSGFAGSSTAPITARRRKRIEGALLRYRIMAFATGVVLVTGCILLIVKYGFGEHAVEPVNGLIWVLHGYLFLVYLAAALDLGLVLRMHLVRLVPVALAGTIPTMSFVAEHFVTRDVRRRLQASTDAPTRASA